MRLKERREDTMERSTVSLNEWGDDETGMMEAVGDRKEPAVGI